MACWQRRADELETLVADLQPEVRTLRAEAEEAQPAAASSAVTMREWLAALFVPPNGHASDTQTKVLGALKQVRPGGAAGC